MHASEYADVYHKKKPLLTKRHRVVYFSLTISALSPPEATSAAFLRELSKTRPGWPMHSANTASTIMLAICQPGITCL